MCSGSRQPGAQQQRAYQLPSAPELNVYSLIQVLNEQWNALTIFCLFVNCFLVRIRPVLLLCSRTLIVGRQMCFIMCMRRNWEQELSQSVSKQCES